MKRAIAFWLIIGIALVTTSVVSAWVALRVQASMLRERAASEEARMRRALAEDHSLRAAAAAKVLGIPHTRDILFRLKAEHESLYFDNTDRIVVRHHTWHTIKTKDGDVLPTDSITLEWLKDESPVNAVWFASEPRVRVDNIIFTDDGVVVEYSVESVTEDDLEQRTYIIGWRPGSRPFAGQLP